MKAALVLALLLAVPSAAWGQNCTRGKRCGNTCIAVTDTCHVGGGEANNDVNFPLLLGVTAGIVLFAGIIYLASGQYDSGYSLEVDKDGKGGTVGYRWAF